MPHFYCVCKQIIIVQRRWNLQRQKVNWQLCPQPRTQTSSIIYCNFINNGTQFWCSLYQKLECKTFEDYHMAYLKADVHLLADASENFRKLSFHNNEFDPLTFNSAPSLAWDAMLLKNKH